jgi:hypothetical protein
LIATCFWLCFHLASQFIFLFFWISVDSERGVCFRGKALARQAHEDEEEWWAGDGVDPLYDRQAREVEATSHLPRRLANCLTILEQKSSGGCHDGKWNGCTAPYEQLRR